MLAAPDLPVEGPLGGFDVYGWVARFAGQPDMLEAILRRHCGYYSLGCLEKMAVRTDMLRIQLWDSGITVVKVAHDLGDHQALLVRKGGDERGHVMSLSARTNWRDWPLYFAHEMGHAWAPSTCGWDLDPRTSSRKELTCEAFAQLWLCQPGNRDRARRLLRPLFDQRCRNILIREDELAQH